MSTTLLAVEILVIGYQGLVWLALVACLFHQCDKTLIDGMKDWKELVFIASVVAAYSTGAIMNGIAAKIMEPIEGKWIYKRPEKQSEMRAAILIKAPEVFDRVMKNFDVPRVLRSTVFNVFLIGTFSFIHAVRLSATCSTLWIIAISTVLGAGLAAWAWYEVDENYFIHLTRTYDALNPLGTERKSEDANG